MYGFLRTLLALNVVLLHIFNVPSLGNYSVSFFFILSGFLMTLIVHNTYGFSLSGFKLFWINRILRLYPVYWFILLVTIIILLLIPDVDKIVDSVFIPNSINQWMANISLFYPEIVPHKFNPRIVPTSWALTNELLFYILISLGISKTKTRTCIWILLSIFYYMFTYYYYNIPTYRYSAIFASSLPFSIGSMLYWVIKSFKLRSYSFYHIIIFYFLFLVNALVSYNFSFFVRELSIYLNMVLAAMLIFMLYATPFNYKIKIIDKRVGAYSYPIYLSHYLVAFIYILVVNIGVKENSFKMYFSALPIYSIMLFSFCYIIINLIDKKINIIRHRIKQKLVIDNKDLQLKKPNN